MKPLLLLLTGICCFTSNTAWAREASVPNRWGVYIADVSSGKVRSMGDFSDWELSPNGRFIVGGSNVGTTNPFYEVSVVSTSGGSARRLERFPVDSDWTASFRWSPDAARVRVEADRDDDGKNEFKTFHVGRASTARPPKIPRRHLSASALKRLKARYPHVSYIAFSPSGTRVVAYLSRSSYEKPDYDGGLWIFAPDGRNLKRLTRNEPYSDKRDFWDVNPHWLPDGKRLAFERTALDAEI